MKRMIVLMVMFVAVGCSENTTEQAKQETSVPAVDKQVQAPVVTKELETKAETAAEPKVIEKPVETKAETKQAQHEVVKAKAAEPVLTKVEPDETQAVTTKTVENQERITPAAVPSKVVAPLTQGKGEIRSEPKNPPKQGMMLKASLGDAVAGKKVAKKCMSCHTFDQGGKKKTGPNLFGIVGKAKGADAKFKYGTYLKDIGGVWDEESLKAWVADSKGIAKAAGKKTKMASQKIKGKKADDLIAYLKTLK